MNRTIGVDLAETSYVFSPDAANAGTVTISGVALRLEQIKLITNATRNQIIYNWADASVGAFAFQQISATECELTLVADTSTQDSADRLDIIVNVDSATTVDVSAQGTMAMLLTRILSMLLAPLGYRKDTQRYQASAVLESGTVTTCTTVNQLNGLAADRLINSENLSAWAACHRSRIS